MIIKYSKYNMLKLFRLTFLRSFAQHIETVQLKIIYRTIVVARKYMQLYQDVLASDI